MIWITKSNSLISVYINYLKYLLFHTLALKSFTKEKKHFFLPDYTLISTQNFPKNMPHNLSFFSFK